MPPGRRFDLTEEELQRVAQVRSRPIRAADVAKMLLRSPKLVGEMARSAAGAVTAGAQDATMFSLIDAERIRQAVPDAASGAAWVDERPFLRVLEPQLREDMRVLDLGGGAGRFARHVAPRVREVVVQDVSKVLLAEAEKNLAGLPNVDYVCTKGFDLGDLADASFDLVFAQGVFSYFELNPALAMFSEVRRVLVDGGRFVFNVFTIDKPEWADDALEDIRTTMRRGRPRAGLYRVYTEGQLETMCAAAGLDVTDRRYEGEDLYPGGHLACVLTAEARAA